MKDYPEGSHDELVQTAVMSALPHATHPMHGDWRTKADALIESLRLDGFEIVATAERDALQARRDHALWLLDEAEAGLHHKDVRGEPRSIIETVRTALGVEHE